MAPGRYRVFALDDQNRDYRYDNPMEEGSVPGFSGGTLHDAGQCGKIRSSWIASPWIPSSTVPYTRFLPDDLLLRTFLSGFQRRYLQKHERPEERKLEIFFAAPN